MDKNKDIIDAINLYKENNIYKNINKNSIAQHLIPSVSLNQYKVFRYETTGVAYGFTNWAFLNKWTINNLSNYLLDDDYINWIRLNKQGSKIKRINKMTLKEGKRKFVGKAA